MRIQTPATHRPPTAMVSHLGRGSNEVFHPQASTVPAVREELAMRRWISRWRAVNTAAGYVVFGLPAAVACPALIATMSKYGPWSTLTTAVPAALWAVAPLLMWIRYTRRRPRTRVGTITWIMLAVIFASTLLASPLWFWVGPALTVLTSEAARVLLSPGLRRAGATVRAIRARVGASQSDRRHR